MRKLLLLTTLLTTPSFAADMPALAKSAVVVAPSPFFAGIHGGMGWTNREYQGFTLPGDVSGNFYPTGGLVGLTVGAATNFGAFYAEAFADADYVLSRATLVGTDAFGNTFNVVSKNGFQFREGVFFGLSLPTITLGQLSASWNNITIGPEGGAVQRQMGACLVDGVNPDACAQRWYGGTFVGGQAKFAITPNSAIRIQIDHDFYNSAWTQTGGAAVLGQFRVINANSARVGWTYTF